MLPRHYTPSLVQRRDTVWADVVLIQKDVEGKLEGVDPIQEGKDHTKDESEPIPREFKIEAVQLVQTSKKPLAQIV
jgi:hypothetical protein